MQSNVQLIKFTLMFNVGLLPDTEISVHAEFSHCRQNWYYGLQAMYSSMTLKVGGPCTLGPPTLPESEGVRTPGPPRDRRHWCGLLTVSVCLSVCTSMCVCVCL